MNELIVENRACIKLVYKIKENFDKGIMYSIYNICG